jgi:hypothetical protein
MEFQNIAIVKIQGPSHLRVPIEQALIVHERRNSLPNLFIGIKKGIQ